MSRPTPDFSGKKIYYAGSIRGGEEQDKDLPWKIVRYMADHGAEVLSEHVAGRTHEEREAVRAVRVGEKILEAYGHLNSDQQIRKIDLDWVSQADYMVALVNAPSLGVGMEIQYALQKPLMGMPLTPILALVHQNMRTKLSAMVQGITESQFHLHTYETFEDIRKKLSEFLIEE